MPIYWRYIQQCRSCTGIGKTGGKICSDCDGKGELMRKDITDSVRLPIPRENDPMLAPNIAGYISPDIDTWDRYDKELEILEVLAQNTHWGTHVNNESNETATGRFIDVQPVMNRLNKYADVAEWVEKKITEWLANFWIPTKPKDESISIIAYGRNYIMESADTLLKRYEEAKAKGDSTVILDRLLNEWITVKYRNDPQWLRTEIKKLKLEPHVHLTIEQVFEIYGQQAAQRKGLFNEWWKSLTPSDVEKSEEQLDKDFDQFIINELEKVTNINTNQNQ